MKKIIIIISLFIGVNTFGQQTAMNSLYSYNLFMINPATAGLEKSTNFNLTHRQQWVGFEGAPVTTWFTAQSQLNDKMGIGGSFSLDKMDFLERMSASLSYSYKLKINNSNKIYFGLSAGMLQGKLDLNNVLATDYTDEVLLNPNLNGTTFDAQFGIHFVSKGNLHLGVSFPQILQSDINLDLQTIEGAYSLTRHTIAYASYDMKIDEQVKFSPMLLVRDAQFSNRQVDFMGNFSFNNKYWGGIGIRQSTGFIVNLGLEVVDNLNITYAYGFTNSGISSNTGGSHEIMLSYKISKNKKEEELEEEIPDEEKPTERKAPSSRF